MSKSGALAEQLRAHRTQIPSEFARLGDALWVASEDRLAHAQCLAMLPTFVDAELEGARVAAQYPGVKHHLDGCNECAGLYIELLEVVLAEERNQLRQPDVTLSLDLSFLPPRLENP